MFENFSDLTVGQRNALDALAGGDVHVTRQQASDSLGISVWNLNTQIQRVKNRSPIAYRLFTMRRAKHLKDRHETALARADEHSHKWYIRKIRAERRLLRMVTGQVLRNRSWN